MTNEVKYSRILALLILIIAIIGGAANSLYAGDLEFSATVDRTTIDKAQTLTLTLTAEGAIRSVPDPNLPDFSDFRILSGPNQSSNFQYINGVYSFSKTFTYVLRPLKTGTLTIGSAEIKYKKKTYRTQPIVIRVTGGRTQPQTNRQPSTVPQRIKEELPEVFVRVMPDKTEIYQNEQVILTYSIYTRVTVNAYEISRTPSAPGFWSEELDAPKQPVVNDEVIAGRHYRTAVIRKVALFPTRPGELTVDPLEVTCQVQTERTTRRSRDPFGSLFDDPFNRYRTEKRFVETDPLTIKVLPLPAEGRPKDFNGAVGQYSLEVKLDHRQVKAHEAMTMTLRYSGTGNVKLLPAPDFKAPPEFEAYEPKESVKVSKKGNRIFGSKTFEIVLIPRQNGKLKIPPVTFSYFDPAVKRYRTLTKGGFEINVEKGDILPASGLPGVSREEVKMLAEDIRYLKSPGRLLPAGAMLRLPSGYLAGMALPPLLALLLWGGVRILGGASLQARRKARKAYFAAIKELRILEKSSALAADSGAVSQFYGGIHNVFLRYLSLKLELSATGLKEEEVWEHLALRQIPDEITGEIKEIIDYCNLARFAPESSDVSQMESFIKRAQAAIDGLEKNWSNGA